MKYLTKEIADMDRQLETETARNKDAKLLASMLDVGTFVALLMAVEIDGIQRFYSPKNWSQ